MTYRIKVVAGHAEVFDRQGRFLFSADTAAEAREELALWETAQSAPAVGI